MTSVFVKRPGIVMIEDWQLTPEGAVIHAGERTVVIADVHLGYEWARAAAGDCVFAHSLEETVARLSGVLCRAPVSRLVVAGDLVESCRPCPRTCADVRRLSAWLAARGVTLTVLEGNHDRSPFPSSRERSPRVSPLPPTCSVGGWTIGHGDWPIAGPRTISGHHHPVFRYEGTASPCFLIGPGRIVLPAFTSNAAGCDVASATVPDDWRKIPLRCIVSTESELLDFGTLPDLRHSCVTWCQDRFRKRSVDDPGSVQGFFFCSSPVLAADTAFNWKQAPAQPGRAGGRTARAPAARNCSHGRACPACRRSSRDCPQPRN